VKGLRRRLNLQNQCRGFPGERRYIVFHPTVEIHYQSGYSLFPIYCYSNLKTHVRCVVPLTAAVHEIAEEDCHVRTQDFVHEAPIAFHIEVGVKLGELEKNASSWISVFINQLRIRDQCYSIRVCPRGLPYKLQNSVFRLPTLPICATGTGIWLF
jgi:hypothetical protein